MLGCMYCSEAHGDIRDGRMDQVNKADKVGGDGIGKSANSLFAGLLVFERGKIGVEELVGLADRDVDRDPVTSRRLLDGSEAVFREPLVDSGDRLGLRSNESLNLWTENKSAFI